MALLDQGNRVVAENVLREALSLKKAALEPDDLLMGITLAGLGIAVDYNGNMDEAKQLHTAALTIYRMNGDANKPIHYGWVMLCRVTNVD